MTRIILFASAIALFASCGSNGDKTMSNLKSIELKYPETRKDSSVKDVYFGVTVNDPYRWLEDDTSTETAAWVKVQNVLTENYLSEIQFREAIRKRYETLYNYEKYSAPFKEGKFSYYYKNSGLQNQYVLYRETDTAKEEVFLDANTFSADGTTSLAGINFSKDGSHAAYFISEGGSDWQKLIVMDAETNRQSGDTLDIKFSGASWKGNEGFYYSTYEKSANASLLSTVTASHKVYYHKLGTAQKADKLIFGNDADPIRYISATVSENQKWLIISASRETYGNALYILDLNKPGAAMVNMVPDMKNQHQVIYVDDQYFYIQTDKDAPTGQLVIAPLKDPGPANWRTIIEAKPEVLAVSAAGGSFFCSYLKDALTKVYQYDIKGKQIREVQLPGMGTAYGFSAKKEEKELYFVFTSYINPSSIYKLNIKDGNIQLHKQPRVQVNLGEYESKQVFYTSKDGTKIPMIITHKKGLELNGRNPCLLYGYGGFSVSLTPHFLISIVILMENGGIYAVPNIRGGGEYGEEWHQQGIKLKKQNVFDDFIEAAQCLVDSNYTSRNLLAIQGGSNGGLLVGACITQEPSMCKVAIPEVGVLDMLRYHKFTAGAGWASDYGTSEESEEMFEYLHEYSPLHNVKDDTAYPATLILTADHDDRVVPAHSFKFAATLQEKQKGKNPSLIRIETKAGHGAGMSTRQLIDEQADIWSFIFYNMGVKPSY